MALVLRGMQTDFGIDVECQMESDSSAAGIFSERIGSSLRRRHLHTKFLWIQEGVHDVDLRVSNPIYDVETSRSETATGPTLEKHCKAVGLMIN